MDLTKTIAPKSDQLNADDLITGPVTGTVGEVSEGTVEQPVNVHLVEFPGRAYRPSKSMRRVMVAGWGVDSGSYVGRTLTLFCNPDITFGKERTGGIQISHMSDLTKPLTVSLTATRGRRKPFTVQPMVVVPVRDVSGRDWLLELAEAGGDVDAVSVLGRAARVANAGEPVLATIRVAYVAAVGASK